MNKDEIKEKLKDKSLPNNLIGMDMIVDYQSYLSDDTLKDLAKNISIEVGINKDVVLCDIAVMLTLNKYIMKGK